MWLMWLKFLTSFECIQPFPQLPLLESSLPQISTDISTSKLLGFGVYFEGRWSQAKWPQAFLLTEPSIALLELIPITLALTMWGPLLQNCTVLLKLDNKAVVAMVNKQMSPCQSCMKFIHPLVLRNLQNNISLKCIFIYRLMIMASPIVCHTSRPSSSGP